MNGRFDFYLLYISYGALSCALWWCSIDFYLFLFYREELLLFLCAALLLFIMFAFLFSLNHFVQWHHWLASMIYSFFLSFAIVISFGKSDVSLFSFMARHIYLLLLFQHIFCIQFTNISVRMEKTIWCYFATRTNTSMILLHFRMNSFSNSSQICTSAFVCCCYYYYSCCCRCFSVVFLI